jgi:hypothetical protein
MIDFPKWVNEWVHAAKPTAPAYVSVVPCFRV